VPEERKQHDHAIWNILYGVFGVALVGQLVLLFLRPTGAVAWLVLLGWALFVLSGLFGWIPIFAFRRRGRVPKGKTYIYTTQLVTTGLYAILRHPKFVAGDLLAVAVMCITQHWSVILAGGIGVAANHLTMIKADRDLVTKFGEPYREYMKRVPQWNLGVGIWRRLRRA